MKFRMKLVLLTLASAEFEWTKYSDRADLPMSKNARDRMREKLREVDPERISEEQKVAYYRLKELLDESPVEDDAIGLELLLVPLMFLLIVVFLRSRQAPVPVDMDEAREARLKKFT